MLNTENRTSKLALISYASEDSQGKPLNLYATFGEEVKVATFDLERFDALNDQHDGNAVHPSVPEPGPLDHGAGGPVGDLERPERDTEVEADINEPAAEDSGLLEEPTRKSPLADWQAYAEQEGVATEHEDGTAKTKRELVDELTAED